MEKKQPTTWKEILENDESFKLHLKQMELEKLKETETQETEYSFDPFHEFYQCKKCQKLLPRTKIKNHLRNKTKCYARSRKRKWEEMDDSSSTSQRYFALFSSVNDSGVNKHEEQSMEQNIKECSIEKHMTKAKKSAQRPYKIIKDLVSSPSSTGDGFEDTLPNNLVPPASSLEESSTDTLSLETPPVDVPGTSQESCSTPPRQRASQAPKKGLKRKTNPVLKVTEYITECLKERHLAFQKESDQNVRMKTEEHKLRMKVLQAKLKYYNALTKGLSTKDK